MAVSEDEDAKDALTEYAVMATAGTEFAWVAARPITGRTHQIRVHLAHLGYPVAGDDKYGDFALNKKLAHQGLDHMFLHARKTVIEHPRNGARLTLEAPLPSALQSFLAVLDAGDTLQ